MLLLRLERHVYQPALRRVLDGIADQIGQHLLDAQRIEMGAYAAGFDIDPATRQALMLGLDRIGETLTHADRIRAFEKAYLGRKPWLMGADSDEH